MDLRKKLQSLARVIADEVARNPSFRDQLLQLFMSAAPKTRHTNATSAGIQKRAKNRRAPAALDPIEVVASGVEVLRSRLAPLNIEQLQDIVAEYGMDPGKVVAKWRTPDRIIDRIVEIASVRAQKGDAFRRELPPKT
jgi:hypothetical protein